MNLNLYKNEKWEEKKNNCEQHQQHQQPLNIRFLAWKWKQKHQQKTISSHLYDKIVSKL